MINVNNLSYTYNLDDSKLNAVDNLNFSLSKGETLGIIGRTGSGKSTLAKLLNGLLRPTSGEIILNNKDIFKDFKSPQQVFFKVGLVFQYPEHQLFERTVFDDIAFGPRNKGCSENEVKILAREAAELVGLSTNLFSKSPLELSGGEKRRCAIAGVLALKPEVLILDEPTAGLDFFGKKSLMECLKNYHKKEQNIMILISHSMEEIASMTEKVLVMANGKMVCFDTAKNVFKNSQLLENIGLEIPQITKIMHLIRERGFNVSESILTTHQAQKEILKLLNKDGGNQ